MAQMMRRAFRQNRRVLDDRAQQIVDELSIWGQEHRHLIRETWRRARARKEWPEAEELTRELFSGSRPLDVFAVASQMPPALGRLDSGRVVLTVRGASFHPGAKHLLVRYVRGVALAVSRYRTGKRNVRPEVTTTDFRELGVSEYSLDLLWMLIDAEPWALKRVDDHSGEKERRYEISGGAVLQLRGVRTLPAYLRAQAAAWWSGGGPRAEHIAFGPAGVGRMPQLEVALAQEPGRALEAVSAEYTRMAKAGHYREAIDRAVVALMSELRRLADLELDGDDLVNRALGPNHPRVVVANTETATGQNVQRGTHLLARGLVAAIRNPTAHELLNLSEEEAREQLGIVCFLARRLDEAAALRAATGSAFQ